MKPQLSNPTAIAEAGERIYRDQYKEQYERDYPGKFVAIDVASGKAYVADTPEGVLEQARADSADGIFHLIQVGQPGAFRVSYTNHSNVDWIFR